MAYTRFLHGTYFSTGNIQGRKAYIHTQLKAFEVFAYLDSFTLVVREAREYYSMCQDYLRNSRSIKEVVIKGSSEVGSQTLKTEFGNLSSLSEGGSRNIK